MQGKISRREFLRSASVAAGAGLLAACAPQATPVPPTAAPQKIVETVIVEGTPQVIEKIVTVTPLPPTAPEPYTIKIWSGWDLDVEMNATKDVFPMFAAANPGLTIEHTVIPDFETKFRTAAASNSLPDVFSTDGINVPAYACRGLLTDLTPIIPQNIRDDYRPPIYEEIMWMGKQWGVPIECHAQGIYYNQDWLDELGMQYPITWPDVLSMCAAISAKDKKKFGYSYPIGGDAWSAWWVVLAMWQAGGRVTDESESKVVVNSPECVEAVEYLQSLYQKNYVPKEGQLAPTPAGPFNDQFVCVTISGSWGLQNMVKQPPTFKWGWGPVPYGNKNVQGVSGGWHWTMWRQGKHPEESAKVISWLAGDEFGMEAAKRFRIISPRKSIGAKLPELSVEPFTTCLDMIDNYGKVTRPHNTEYPNLMDVLGEALGNACIGGKPAKDELERAAEKMNKILASAAPCGV